MPRDPRTYLDDMEVSARHVLRMASGKDFSDYTSNDQFRWAVERQLSILGEALYQLNRHFPELAKRVPDARRIINFRHVLIHGYAQVQDSVVWGIVEQNVVVLLSSIEDIRKGL